MDDELCFLGVQDLRSRYCSRQLSPVEVTRAVLERIAAVNPHVNAVCHVDPEGALAQAQASERRWRHGAPHGEFDGIPVTVKDSVAVAGMPAPNGTRAAANAAVEPADAPATARLREQGAVLIGKTTMPDYGMTASGVSSLYGITRNPWNLARNCGGSSSGAGVAVAAGFGPVAVGEDIGGSVRIPAAFCGVVGLKPSYGRVPLDRPCIGLVIGPLARTVADAALLLRVISRADARDCTALPHDDRDYLAGIDAGVRGLRMGLLLDIGFGLPVEPAVRERVEDAAARLTQCGAHVEPMRPIFEADPEPDFDRMLLAYAWAEFGALPAARQAAALPEFIAWCRQCDALSAADLTRALMGIGASRHRVLAACNRYDYVLAPTMAIEPYAAELPWPIGGTRHNPFCFPFNLSEQPALSVCCGLTRNGLPVGLQIIGRRCDDAGVLRVGRAYEAARGCMPRPPEPRPAPHPAAHQRDSQAGELVSA
jgi:aspartyl-tRNA(Asn)/glutamyl-tRNA(Gln) amidotransferase subunit A